MKNLNIGSYIRAERLRLGISQSAMARDIGLSSARICQLESGQEVNADNCVIIGRYLAGSKKPNQVLEMFCLQLQMKDKRLKRGASGR